MLPPISVADRFPELHHQLVELLRALDAREWSLPTVAPAWTVKDVAAHLLDTQQRVVGRLRGEPQASAPAIHSHDDLVAFINALNAQGVNRFRQLDPAVLIAMLEDGAPEFARHHASLDPFAPAMFPVSWAGESSSPNWFHTAREFTERWHHQQQIRLATNRPGIMTPELYHPVLDCFLRALPFAYRDIARDPGTVVRFTIAGGCGGRWHLQRDPEAWRLVEEPAGSPAAEAVIPQEIAWRIFTKGMSRADAERQVRLTGDAALAARILGMIAIVG
jgi:uncharacterized protein (TIGR03083 family)